MAQSSAFQKLKQTETEIAVLQVQYTNLTEKVDEMKTDLKDLRSSIDTHMGDMKTVLKDFQEENKKQHDAVEKKVSALEKWRWTLMGAGMVAGALGWPIIAKLTHVG